MGPLEQMVSVPGWQTQVHLRDRGGAVRPKSAFVPGAWEQGLGGQVQI